MSNYTIGDGQTVQSQQNGSPSDLYILGNNSTLVMAGAGIAFATGVNDTIFDTGISAQPGGYVGDQIVLGANNATVLVGGLGSTIYGGTGSANIFYDAAATLITGSNGTINIVGNERGDGISYTGGIKLETHDSAGTHIVTGQNERVNLFAAAPLS